MAELITLYRSAIPEFAAFPLKKSILDEYLGSLPQDVIELSFRSWSSDTGFERSLGGGRSRKEGVRVPDKTRVLSAHYGLSEECWQIWVRPVRKAELQPIKAALVPDGLVRLNGWLLKRAAYDGSNGQRPGSFEITFDGRELTYVER